MCVARVHFCGNMSQQRKFVVEVVHHCIVLFVCVTSVGAHLCTFGFIQKDFKDCAGLDTQWSPKSGILTNASNRNCNWIKQMRTELPYSIGKT